MDMMDMGTNLPINPLANVKLYKCIAQAFHFKWVVSNPMTSSGFDVAVVHEVHPE